MLYSIKFPFQEKKRVGAKEKGEKLIYK